MDFGFIIDYPTKLSFYIALSVFIIFIIFSIISATIVFRDMDLTKVKLTFLIFNLILLLPAIFCFVTVVSYSDTKSSLKTDELMLYKKQFALIDDNLDIKYSIISKENRYYKYEALLYNIQKGDSSANFKEFRDLCLNSELNINCAVKYNAQIYMFYDDYYLDKIFNTKEDIVKIDENRFKREKLLDVKEFKYIGSNQEQSLDDKINVFVKKLADSHINYYSANHLEDNEIDIVIKEKFPITIDKYKGLLKAFEEFEKENELYQINIVFENHKINYDKLRKEINQ